MAKKFLSRSAATKVLNEEEGIEVGPTGLANMASNGAGPRYAVVNGRAVYTREDLTAWVCKQAAIPPLPRRRREKAASEKQSTETGAV